MSGHSIKTLVALDHDVDRDRVQSALPVDGGIEIVGLVDGLEESWSTLQETQTDLLVVACSDHSDRALFLIDGAARQRPERPIVVLFDGMPDGFVRRAFEAGADDLVTLPGAPGDLRFSFEKAVARKQGSSTATGTAVSPLICVLGPKGGAGKTLVSSNLATALAGAGRSVAVVDLDLQFGDVGLSLGLAPEKTIHDLAKSGGTLDAEKLDGYLARHASGARVLMAPTRPDHAGVVSGELLREVYALLRSTHDFVIVDTPPGFTPEVIAATDVSSDICMVGVLDSLSLKNTKLGLETLDMMGYGPERIRLVLNRADSRVGITQSDVEAIVGRSPDVLIPSDRDIPRAVNEGTPILLSKPRSEAAKAFRALAGLYAPAAEAPRRRRFGRRS
ncbi:MAG TPA: P-loop NTPase [Gaiellaceae bacterium]|nr:P-loop NTPase [Gaiellaceae bacterium]